MLFQVKVRVDLSKMTEFGEKLLKGELDRSCIRGATYCLKNDPAVGYSIWEADSRSEFNVKFNSWRNYYSEVDVDELITPIEAMSVLFGQLEIK